MKKVTGRIYRDCKIGKNAYTSIYNDVLQNTDLSFRARGLLTFILSLPFDWIPCKSQIQAKNNYNDKKFNAIWKELVDAGYIMSRRIKNDKGRFSGWEHRVYEIPTFLKEEVPFIGESEKVGITKDTSIQKIDNIQKIDLNKQYSNNSTERAHMDKFFTQSKPSQSEINELDNLI